MKINNKFLRAETLGEKLAMKICMGYDIIVEITDIFGNGRILFEHRDYCTVVVDFTEINVNDTVEIEWFKLGKIVRTYKN